MLSCRRRSIFNFGHCVQTRRIEEKTQRKLPFITIDRTQLHIVRAFIVLLLECFSMVENAATKIEWQ